MRGHICKRGSKWAVVVDIGRDPITQKRQQKWHSGYRTRKEAEAALVEIVGRVNRGDYVEPSSQTLTRFLMDWISALERRGLRESTRQSYSFILEKHVMPRIGDVPLQKLNPSHLNALYTDLLAKGRLDGTGGLAPRTVRYAHTVLRSALADAQRWQLLNRNPADAADPPSSGNAKVMNTWIADELASFLGTARNDRLYAAWHLTAMTGTRRGETLGLRRCDVNLAAGCVSIVQTVIAPRYRVQFSEPKTPRSRRSISIDRETTEVLREHLARQDAERAMFGSDYRDHDLAFCQPDGSPIIPHLFSQAFERLVKAAELPRIRLHDLRHTHASLALAAGYIRRS